LTELIFIRYLDHTHLVKGLDYSLLNKTRNEMKTKDVVIEEEDDIEQAFQVRLL
jgi:hypothetical protein